MAILVDTTPYNARHLDVGVAVYRDEAEDGFPYYHHWTIVAEEARRAQDVDADVDNIDQQRMHIIHFRDFPNSSDSSSSPSGQVQMFQGEARLGTQFDKIIMVGKIDVDRIPELGNLARREASLALGEGVQLTCQGMVERVLLSPDFAALLIEKKEYHLRLYGQMHDAAPVGVCEHAYEYTDEEFAKNPTYQ